ncbi:MAG TPA: CBS domain-containing protein [Phycisphaerae bacterium]|nr:CBS domain-containing protein [Phycisphaerae bacterium]
MKCPACEHENLPGTDHCAECHADLSDVGLPLAEDDLLAELASDKLSDLIPRTPVQLSPDTPVRETITRLADSGRNCALVVRDNVLVGILTERDILMKIALDYEALADRPISDFMTPNPESLGEQDNIAFGLNRMTAGDYRHVPIQEGGRPLGVVAVRDVLGYLVRRHPEQLGTA